MKILLDECLREPVRGRLAGHDVFTVGYLGWKGLRNGRLLAAAATDGFDLLLTTDGGIEFQQNLSTLPLAIVVMDVDSNAMADLEPLVPAVLTLLASRLSARVYHVVALSITPWPSRIRGNDWAWRACHNHICGNGGTQRPLWGECNASLTARRREGEG